VLSSRQDSLTPGSSTATATPETRPRCAATMSRPILAASAGCDDDAHTAVAAPAGGAMTRIKAL